MIAKQIGSFADFCAVSGMDDSVRKRRSLTRFQQQEPELYDEYNLRYQLENTDQKPKGRRKKDA